ncbi:MAG: DUF6328 family protein [Ktedonobacterales bacterium]
MHEESGAATTPVQVNEGAAHLGDLSDLLQELRVLLQGVQVLTGFLIILPFSQGFEKIARTEKWVYVATFACSLCSLILFSAPAAQHRLEWPLQNRAQFKRFATRIIIIGLVPLSLALVLATQLIVATVLGSSQGFVAALGAAVVIATVWWLLPLGMRRRGASPWSPPAIPADRERTGWRDRLHHIRA